MTRDTVAAQSQITARENQDLVRGGSLLRAVTSRSRLLATPYLLPISSTTSGSAGYRARRPFGTLIFRSRTGGTTLSAFSRYAALSPLKTPASSIFSTDPYRLTSWAAVLSPTPAIPG